MSNLRKEAREFWMDINGYAGTYQISTYGRVRSLERVDSRGQKRKEKVIKPYKGGNKGYQAVCLSMNGAVKSVRIHRLVAEHFIEREPGKDYVNHKNGDKSDNRAENLEWVTIAENNLHSFRQLNRNASGGGKGKYGAECHSSKPIVATSISCGIVRKFVSAREASKHFGVSVSTVSRTCNGKGTNVRGYSMRYEHDLQK